ncbi:MAG: cytochrome P450 [Planctomycetes bacterium]|nr:cytochrome P450 [Planctomycetota bacterium]
MIQKIPSASLCDNLVYNFCHVVPTILQGTFTKRRFWVGFWTRVHRDPAAVRFVSRLRKKYGCDYLWIRLGITKSLLVLDPKGIEHILERSPFVYADGKPKRDGMNVFQPNAVTISRGTEWRDRRRFNEAVLDSGQSLHRYASRFLQIIQNEIVPGTGPPPTLQSWDDFDDLFARITRQIIFGTAARNDTTITGLLKKMMRESNRARKPKKSKYFDEFYSRIGDYLDTAEPNTLGALCRQVPSTKRTQVENQIPHWMFAMWETLGTNTVRALALIAAHPRVQEAVRREMAGADLTTTAGIDSLKLLEGCVEEAMRLWPTTPILVRETVPVAELGDEAIPDGTQVLILNSFNHRDRQRYPLADTFAPESWSNGSPNPLFNHLGSGLQACAGKDLALFIAKAVLATLFSGHRYVLVKPALDPNRPMPHAYNYFHVHFSCTRES